VFHVKHEGWDRVTEVLGLSLTSNQRQQLESFESLVLEHAIPLGMIASADQGRLRGRHIEDCLRAATVVWPADGTSYDLGSGAGLPGVVVAIACPSLRVTLVESRRPRAAFLQLVVERLGLANAHVAGVRAETLLDPVDMCFARAFTRVTTAWLVAEPLLRPQGRLVYFAGERFEPAELPKDIVSTMVTRSALARSGPLVIMSRQ
jgi:16S rRNA (guanine527-N7)-methyltransferase